MFEVLHLEENTAVVFPSSSLLLIPGVSSRVFDTGHCRVPIPGGCTSHTTDFETRPGMDLWVWVEVKVPVPD